MASHLHLHHHPHLHQPATSTSSSVKSSAVMTPVNQTVNTQSSSVKSSVVTTPVNQTVNTQSRTSITNTKTSVLEDWTPAKPADKPSVSLKTSDVSYSPTRSSPSAVTVNTRYSYRSDSAPLDELSDSLLSGSVYSQPVRSQSESVSVSPRVSTSSSSSAQTSITNTKSSVLEDWTPAKPADKPSVSLKTSDVSYSPTRSSPSAVTVNTRYSYRSDSAPLDELSDSLLSGSVYSQPVRSQTQTRSVYSEFPADSASLSSSLESSRPMSSRDLCSVCGKAMAGGERMILEELKINSHTSCFRCAVCRCDLGSLEAGKSLWVYRERVNCSNCYSKVRGQWYI
nr:sciellin-like [Danio rerio]|eukprot:XP_021333014.1 sciellin-like [Danio rerio]